MPNFLCDSRPCRSQRNEENSTDKSVHLLHCRILNDRTRRQHRSSASTSIIFNAPCCPSDANSSALTPLPESRTRNKRGHRYGDERGSHRLQETAWTGICACWSSASVNAILQIPTGAGKRPPGLLPGIMGGTR